MKKIILTISLILGFPITGFAGAYIQLDGGMFAAHWESAPLFQNYAPTGTPKGGAWRGALGYQIDDLFNIEAGATYYDPATRYLNGHRYTIRQKSYSFLVGIRSPELFWHYRAFAKFGFAHFQGELEGLTIPVPVVGDVHFPPNTVKAFRPAYVIGMQQEITKHFYTQFQWYHIDGEANVATQQTFDNVASIDQSIPSVNVFMGGIAYRF